MKDENRAQRANPQTLILRRLAPRRPLMATVAITNPAPKIHTQAGMEFDTVPEGDADAFGVPVPGVVNVKRDVPSTACPSAEMTRNAMV